MKKKGDLISFAAKHPGALSGWFLAGIYARLCKGMIRESKQLREASVSAWIQNSGLTDVRDVREAMTVAMVMDCLNRAEIARAMDVLAQRLLALQCAKAKKGGSWEKAEALELIPSSGASMLPGGMASLAG